MSSPQEDIAIDGSEIGRGRVSKSKKSRRSWSTQEEAVLLVALKELVVQGWKADNGFRAGYLNKLEDAMRNEFPNTDLRGMPHINSKISAWKKNYNSLLLMFSKSGFGFNLKGTFMIDCTNELWEEIVKCDNNAENMRFKSWPLFEDWKQIFGKDRATGEHAEDVMEAVNKVYAADNMAQDSLGQSSHDEVANDTAEASACHNEKGAGTTRTSSKKRKARNAEVDILYLALKEISSNTDKRLADLANRTGYEFDLGKARQTIFEQLSCIPGLSRSEKFDVCEILADKVQRLEIFIGLPEDAKYDYVMRLLHSKNN
ncbi:uncharacterized protein At2g29880-like [Salvia miltiorrhiza]|uniref:uncharacterized protein At2g29880-like n=1 Tax=Salvia miltiorrhiza TaxID=226208 RepID=UPI0025AD154F|nr:uncharacterized protein At2g29880-like [Salvia miltiorrhiza]